MREVLITSSVLILALLLLRLLGKRVSARLRYALWGLVLVRLFLPAGLLTSPASVMNAVESPPLSSSLVLPTPQPTLSPTVSVPLPVQPAASEAPSAPAVPAQPTVPSPPAARPAPGMTLAQVLRWVWLGGILAVGGYFLLSNLRFYRRLRAAASPCHVPGCPLPVYVAQALPTPCMAGLFAPAIYIQASLLGDETRLAHVLAHEETHHRHGDNGWALLRGICLALWWFHPLVWVAAYFSRRDCELACDEAALKRLGETQRISYGKTLVGLTAPPAPADLLRCTTAMTAGKRALKERVLCIANRRVTRAATVLALVLALGLAACTLTGPQVTAPPMQEAVRPNGPSVGEEGPTRRNDFYTFLVVGQDSASGTTDTVLLAAYNIHKQSLNFMSLPRDTMVNVPWDIKKLNSVSSVYGGGEAGLAALKETVSRLTGLPIDFTFSVEWAGVGALVDAIGGVDFDVPREMHYKDGTQNLTIDLKKGPQRLDGAGAMALLCYRMDSDEQGNAFGGYPDGDLGRISVQQDFLRAALAQCLAQIDEIPTLVKLAGVFANHVKSELAVGELVWLGQRALFGTEGGAGLSMEDVRFHTMPWVQADQVLSREYGVSPSYIAPDGRALAQLLNEGFNPYWDMELSGSNMDLMQVNAAGFLSSTNYFLEDKEYNQWLLEERMQPDESAKAELLAAVAQLFAGAERGPTLRYWAEPGSGPSSWEEMDADLMPVVQEIFARYRWMKTDSNDWDTPLPLPEGAAVTMDFFNERNTRIGMDYATPTIRVELAEETTLYMTADYRAFYRELEELWYRYKEAGYRAWVVRLAGELWQGGTVTARLERADGSTEEWDVSERALGTAVGELLGGRDHWMWLPGGPTEGPLSLGESDRLTLMGTGEDTADLVIYAQGSYLHGPGYWWRSISDTGTDTLFASLCAVLGR